MGDLPENLQIIKREYSASPPAFNSTEPSDYTIKTKLNLHVKKRLQQVYECNKHNLSNIINKVVTADNEKSTATNNIIDGESKKFIRTRKPYHKKIDVSKERKCKYKLKQLVNKEVVNKEVVAAKEVATSATPTNHNTVSAGDDDDGSNENDIRIVRDKEKHPDVLSMVLSTKKRALFANSEVQKFLGNIIRIMKT